MIEMKKSIGYIIMLLLLSLSVFSAPQILLNETEDVTINAFTLIASVNETSDTYFELSSGEELILSGNENNITEKSLRVLGLAPNTTYDYFVTFTNDNNQSTTVYNSVTTEQASDPVNYTFFTFMAILIAVALITKLDLNNATAKEVFTIFMLILVAFLTILALFGG